MTARLHDPADPVPAGAAVLDVRWQLGRSDGRAQHLAGHLPGAAYVDLETDLADPVRDDRVGGRHPLPDPERFAAAMRRCGVRSDRPALVYDDTSGLAAARCWWLLTHHGHDDVRLLDGGFSAWQGPVEVGPTSVEPGDFEAGPGRLPVVGAAGAARLAQSGVLIDARAPERFRGETEPVDPVAGHIPGAVNVPTSANLVDGRFASESVLRAAYATALDGVDVGVSCGSGVTAAHDLFALSLLGVTGTLYAGSWSDWVSDPTRPVATGA